MSPRKLRAFSPAGSSLTPLLAGLGLIVISSSATHARSTVELLDVRTPPSDLPARAPEQGARSDTVCFGYVQTIGGALYAVPGETWTFDHAGGGPEGWYAVDLSIDRQAYGRRIDAASWGGHGNAIAPPIIGGTASAWIGAFEDEADALCWEAGLGYGNSWCQRWQSPVFTYSGSGDVTIAFDYFQDSELNFDFTRVRLDANHHLVPLAEWSGKIGAPGSSSYAHVEFTVPASSFVTWTSGRLAFDFESDGGWSDEDAGYVTQYGAFGVDNVVLSGGFGEHSYDFESGTEGWGGSTCDPMGTFFGVANLSDYTLLDACNCRLSGHVLELHDGMGDMGSHPYGQHVQMYSPPIDRASLGPAYNQVFATWDTYAVLPRANGVFIRAGWNYFPWICPVTGESGWSGRVANDGAFYWWDGPGCFRDASIATESGVPADAEQVSLVLELFASCDAFGIPTSMCTLETNFTPIYDNVRICATQWPAAPQLAFDPGAKFQDAFPTYQYPFTTSVGNADITFDLHRDSPNADYLGDSLVVRGPIPTSSTKWEARLWWRLPRIGPGQNSNSGYVTWRNAVSDGHGIVGLHADFTSGRMDSAETNTQTAKQVFISEFREDDDDFLGEATSANEMIRDGILTPGTQVQYFVTSNYVCTPAVLGYLPDTTGGNFEEFEILPAYRLSSGIAKYPCMLEIDLDTGDQDIVERALATILSATPPEAPIPNPANWDRYDYADASSNWNAPLARSAGGNNGGGLLHLLGYRAIVLHARSSNEATMESADFQLLSDWMTVISCNQSGLAGRQGLIIGGDDMPETIQSRYPTFLYNLLGAQLDCPSYADAGCGPAGPPDQSNCVRVEPAGGGLYPPEAPYDVYGNWCPQKFTFSVLNPAHGGVGNRVYVDYDRVPPVSTLHAQVVKSVTSGGSDNYRSVLNGYAFGHTSRRGVNGECGSDSMSVVEAATGELRAALNWIFEGSIPTLCSSSCVPEDVTEGSLMDGGFGTQLRAPQPNPFNPRTTLHFSLAATGPASLAIYDVNGRRVRTLVDATLAAGAHVAVWDGTDDDGHRVGAGVYWSQLRTGGYESQKKMVLLK